MTRGHSPPSPSFARRGLPSPALDAVLLLVRTTAAANAALDPALSQVGLWLTDLSLLRFVRDTGPGGIPRVDLAAALRQS